MTNVKRISKHTFAASLDDGRVYFISNRIDGSLNDTLGPMGWSPRTNWEQSPQYVGDAKIVPYGPTNNLPTYIRDVVGDNNLVPGIINRQLGLLWGQGPYLYQLGFDSGQIVQVWKEDPEVEKWLNSWNYKDYLKACMIDYLHLGGFFHAVHLSRGHRIGRTKTIAKLEHIPAKNARLEWTDSRDIRDVKNIYVGDFENLCVNTGIKKYPAYNPNEPGRHPVSAAYNHLYSFSRDFYSVPQFWGSVRWILRGSEIPVIFKYITDNSINLAYHVHSPAAYWDMKRESLTKTYEGLTEAQIEEKIAELTVEMLQNMTDVLAGKENAGKMFHTVDVTDETTGEVRQWKVEPIDQKTKDFIDAQLKVSEASTSAITSGMGLHPSLSNVIINGKLASGSELLYAFKLYLNTDTEIPYSVILEGLNQAIAFNFPEKNLRLGFYHQSVKTEESVSSSNRIKNQ